MSKRDASDFVREEGADRFRERVDQDIGAQRNKSGNGAAKPPRFQLKRFDDIQLSTVPNYLVKGILPRTEPLSSGDHRNAASPSGPSIW